MVQPPFDTQYQVVSVPAVSGADPIPGIPAPYGALAFKAGDPDTLLVAGHVNSTDSSGAASIYSVGVTRDANHHVNGFVNNATLLALAPGFADPSRGIGDGLGFGPNGLLFYTSIGDNSLGEIKAGANSVSHQIDLSKLTPTPINQGGPLAFVPQGFPGAGTLKLADFNGEFYELGLSDDGAGTFDIGDVSGIGVLAGSGTTDAPGDTNEPTGFGYVSGGNPQFAQPNVLATQCDFNTGSQSTLEAYGLDAGGNPVLSSARVVVTAICPAGAVVDPLTGDMLFTTFYGYPALNLLTGFTVAPPAVELSRSEVTVAETVGTVEVVVKRYGSHRGALSVNYATSSDTAVSGVNYSDVSGTLNWKAGENAIKSFQVPIKSDGLYNDTLKFEVALSGPNGAELGAPLIEEVSIANRDPKPTVTLSSTDRSVKESVGAIQLIATLDHAEGLPVSVPFAFSGTATRNRDYSFDLNMDGKPITSIVIPPNATSGSLTIHVTNDSLNEDNETLIATMGTPTNAAKGSNTSNTITIVDDDAPPTVSFARSASIVTEGSAGAGVPVSALQVRLSVVSGLDVSVPVSLTKGTVDGRISVTSPVVIPAGKLYAYALTVADDSTKQPTERLSFSLGAPTHATLGSIQAETLTVKDND